MPMDPNQSIDIASQAREPNPTSQMLQMMLALSLSSATGRIRPQP